MCRTQNTWLVGASCHPFCGSSYTLFIDTCLSEMRHMFACGVTCCLRFFKKKLHVSLVSPSTIAKAMRNILLFPSCATANNSVILIIFFYILCMQKRKPMHKFCLYYTPQLQVEGYLKFLKKKYENTPQVQVAGYNKDKISSLFRVPRNSKWRGTRKSEKVGYFCNFLKK